VRDSSIGGAAGCPQGLWNMVYSGVQGAPAPVSTGQCEQNPVLPTSPVTEEEPFLYADSGGAYQVFVPAVRRDSSGPSRAGGSEAGSSLPLSKFFVANPGMPTADINAALARGRDLILTPGVYHLDQPIVVSHPDTVVLGQGFATLVPQRGNPAMIVVPNRGVKLSGLIIDAGPVTSPVLLSVGTPRAGLGRPRTRTAIPPSSSPATSARSRATGWAAMWSSSRRRPRCMTPRTWRATPDRDQTLKPRARSCSRPSSVILSGPQGGIHTQLMRKSLTRPSSAARA
jgi:hypothetical protein